MCGHGDTVYVLVRKGDIFAKCLDYISDHWLGNTKFHPYGFAGKHIDVFFHILSKIQSLSFCASQRFKRFCGFIQNFQFSDTVKPIIGNIIVFIVITDKIILSFFYLHLVRGNNIFTFTFIGVFVIVSFIGCRGYAWKKAGCQSVTAVPNRQTPGTNKSLKEYSFPLIFRFER